jgi:hypothetical protein
MSASCSGPCDPDNPTGTGRFLSQLDRKQQGSASQRRTVEVREELLIISAVLIVGRDDHE